VKHAIDESLSALAGHPTRYDNDAPRSSPGLHHCALPSDQGRGDDEQRKARDQDRGQGRRQVAPGVGPLLASARSLWREGPKVQFES
jgi:hypothetical protein